MKKYILFDNDGVLVDTEFWYFKANQRALSDLGIPLELSEYLEEMVEGFYRWDRLLKSHPEPERVRRMKARRDHYYQEYLSSEDLDIPGVEPVLARLSKNFRLAIITTCRGPDFELIHRNRNLVSYMDFVLVREDYQLSKPHPEPYLTGLERFGASKEETLIVEDSQRGLLAAVAAGIDCVVVHNKFTESQDFSEATFRINSLEELPRVLN